MSDAAFKTAPFSGYSTAELKVAIRTKEGPTAQAMVDEIERRRRRDAGEMSVMTPGERLRFLTNAKGH